MKWIGLCFFPFWLQAQNLKKGIYRNLNLSEPVVLDTGTYIFVGCEFHASFGAFNGPVLDARKARKVEIHHSKFKGNKNGVAILSSKEMELSHCFIENFDTALAYYGKEEGKLLLFRNQFQSNGVAVCLQTPSESLNLTFALKCNSFCIDHPLKTKKMYKGLVVGKGVHVGNQEHDFFLSNQLGGSGRQSEGTYQYPNGNLWPSLKNEEKSSSQFEMEGLISKGLENTHQNHPGWIAIENQNKEPLRYAKFRDEFVGNGPALQGAIQFQVPNDIRHWILETVAVWDTCIYARHQPKGNRNYKVCELLVDPQPFLLPTFFKTSQNPSFEEIEKPAIALENWSPATGKARLKLWIPEKTQKAVLLYLDPATSEVLQTNYINPRQTVLAELDFAHTELKPYLLRLVLDEEQKSEYLLTLKNQCR